MKQLFAVDHGGVFLGYDECDWLDMLRSLKVRQVSANLHSFCLGLVRAAHERNGLGSLGNLPLPAVPARREGEVVVEAGVEVKREGAWVVEYLVMGRIDPLVRTVIAGAPADAWLEVVSWEWYQRQQLAYCAIYIRKVVA